MLHDSYQKVGAEHPRKFAVSTADFQSLHNKPKQTHDLVSRGCIISMNIEFHIQRTVDIKVDDT